MKRFLVAAIILSACASCTQTTKERIVTVPGEDTETQSGDSLDLNKVRAEKLVATAEDLISPVGFPIADQIVDLALKQDPTNRKAQFYKAALAPMMKLRGILIRANEQRGLMGRQFSQLSATTGVLGAFLRDAHAGPPLKTEAEIQKFLAEIQVERQKIVDFIEKNKTFITRIPLTYVYDWRRMLRECPVERLSDVSYRLTPCPHMQQIKLAVNRADWVVFQQFLMAGEMGISTLLSYNLEGGLNFAGIVVAKRQADDAMSAREKVEIMNQSPNFGLLYPDHRLASVVPRAHEAYSGIMWLYGRQPEFCKKGVARPEHVFKGICLQKHFQLGRAIIPLDQGLDVLRSSLEGDGSVAKAATPFEGISTGNILDQVALDVAAPFKSPIRDLKLMAPRTFDACGNATSFNDPSMGGIFKARNADEFLTRNRRCKLNSGHNIHD